MSCNQPFNSGIDAKNATKTTEEALLVSVDWCDTLEDSDTIVSSVWASDDPGVTLTGDTYAGLVTQAFVSSGTAGTLYTLTNTIETVLGETLQTAVYLLVRDL